MGLVAIGDAIGDVIGDRAEVEALIRGIDAIHVMRITSGGGSRSGSVEDDLMIGAERPGGLGVHLDGKAGSDILIGTGRDDTLIGGTGANILVGGMGNDRYVAQATVGTSTIVSDVGGQDTLVLMGNVTGFSRGTGFAYIAKSLELKIGTAGAPDSGTLFH